MALRIAILIAAAAVLSLAQGAGAAPVAAFSGSPVTGQSPLNVAFTDQSTGSPTGWAWFFGDEMYTNPWTQVNGSAGWPVRAYHSAVTLPDGSIVLTGGMNSSGYFINDTWRSADKGATWTLMNASSGWKGRYRLDSVSMPDGSIVLLGGTDIDGSYKNDVWRSADSGATWVLVNASAGWTGRSAPGTVTLPDGSIVLMGGYDTSGHRNDTWRSADTGATWTLMNASSGWVTRMDHRSVALPDGSIVLAGGSSGNARNDTWRSTDQGATWVLMNATAGWPARYSSDMVALPDGSIVLAGGSPGFGTYTNDIWHSADNGATWTLANGSAGWPVRSAQTSVALPDGSIVLMGGSGWGVLYHDVWRFQPAGSTAQNPTHTYTSPGTYPVALQAYNTGGYNSTRKPGYITVTGGPAPVANFSANVTLGAAPLAVRFTDYSTGSPVSWKWSFGDGNTSSLQHPVQTYAFAGSFNVSMNASNAAGSDTLVKYRYVTVLQSREMAYARVLAMVLNGSALNVSVYATRVPVTNRTVVHEWGRSFSMPDKAGWVFFIDDSPRANWEHPCRYIFVDKDNVITVFRGSSPPLNLALDRIAGIPPPASGMTEHDGSYGDRSPKKTAQGITGQTTGSPTCSPTYRNCYALLISGGFNATYNYLRYSSDISFMYKTLVHEYGYQPDHITVLMSDGTDPAPDRRTGETDDDPPLPRIDNSPADLDSDGTTDVDGVANRANVLAALATLKNTLHNNDHLFIFTTNHGGNNTVPKSGEARLWLWDQQYIWDHELVAELNKIPAKVITITMEQCFSGGFIDDIVTNGNRSHAWVIATATNADGPSYANDFSYPWISAVAGHEPDETQVDADANNDSHISMLEAYDFARANDQSAQYLAEHPQFQDIIAGNGSLLYLNSCSIPPFDTLTVTAPVSGDVWKTATSEPITWTYTGMCGGNVRITLWKGGADGGFQREIAPSVAVTAGSYSWPIPRAISPSTRYWINISSTGMPALYDVSDGALTITASPPCTLAKPLVALPGYTSLPADPNEDCIYEDLNANGRLDFADVVLYFTEMTWIAENEPLEGFDLNYNGRIDFVDIVLMFGRI